MSRVTESAVRFGFAEFELDVRSGELRKNGFFSDTTAAWYAEQARTTALGPITSRR